MIYLSLWRNEILITTNQSNKILKSKIPSINLRRENKEKNGNTENKSKAKQTRYLRENPINFNRNDR